MKKENEDHEWDTSEACNIHWFSNAEDCKLVNLESSLVSQSCDRIRQITGAKEQKSCDSG